VENITPELVTPLHRGLLLIKSVGVVEFQRQMKPAIRIESFNGIKALRYLHVSLTEFRSGCATGCLDDIGMNKHPGVLMPRPYFQASFCLKAEEGKSG
jgi:hypothetical protein